MPDYAVLVVGSNAGNGIIGMTKEHISMAVALELPLIIIITKVDMCPPE